MGEAESRFILPLVRDIGSVHYGCGIGMFDYVISRVFSGDTQAFRNQLNLRNARYVEDSTRVARSQFC
jgi:hypothetical protein